MPINHFLGGLNGDVHSVRHGSLRDSTLETP